MSKSDATHTVKKKGLYFSISKEGERAKELAVGTPMTLTESQATKLGDRVAPIKTIETVDATSKKDTSK